MSCYLFDSLIIKGINMIFSTVQCKILSEDINEANNPGKVPDIKARCKGNAMLISWSPAKSK